MKYLLLVLFAAASWVAAVPSDRPSLPVPFLATELPLEKIDRNDAWKQAAVIDHFDLPLGVESEAAPASTKVAVLWTRQNLLIRFQCAASSITRLPGVSVAARERDLPYYRADCVEVFLDPVGDGRAYIEIQASPDNGIMDGIYLYTAGVESAPDFTVKPDITNRDAWFFKEWNMAGLRSAAAVQLDSASPGWAMVLVIPAKDLLRRLGKSEFAAGMTLRANFLRFDYSSKLGQPAVITKWARVPSGRVHRAPAGMGWLILVDVDR
jgi:hypothetical protein